MSLSEDHLAEWIATAPGGGWLYHRIALEQLLPWVMRDGLLPRQTTGMAGIHFGMASRETHIYLATSNDPMIFAAAGMGEGLAHIRVHASDLRAELMDSDEDKIGGYDRLRSDAIMRLPGAQSLVWPASGSSVGLWAAASSEVIDQPEWVLHSLQQGAVAYRGVIAVQHLRFAADARSRWRPADRGDPPRVERAESSRYWIGG